MADIRDVYNIVNKYKTSAATNNASSNVSNSGNSSKSPYQQNLSQPTQTQQKDFSTRFVMGQIATLGQSDPSLAKEYYQKLQYSMSDPKSQYYNPYNQATNRAVSNLAALGFDTNNLNDNWFNANQGWISSNLSYTGTTNSPSKPGKKATRDQQIAYELYQWHKSEDTTKKAEQEWAALQDELSYWAKDTSRNYSDDQILQKIDWSKYKTLASMDENKYLSPTELNRSIGYSEDAMYGVMWAARNPDYQGDLWGAMANSALGTGNQYTENPEISAKLNKNDLNMYSPYSVGMTLEEEGLYFNVQKFDRKTLDDIRANLDWNDETAVKYYQNAEAAYENTQQAIRERDLFMETLKTKLNGVKDPDRATQIFENLYNGSAYDKAAREEVNFSTLRKMDESLVSTKLLPTTEAVDWKKEDMLQYALSIANENAGKQTGNDVSGQAQGYMQASAGTSDVTPTTVPPKTEEQKAADIAADESMSDVPDLVGEDATPMEQEVMKNSWSVMLDYVYETYNATKQQDIEYLNNIINGTKTQVMNNHATGALSNIQGMYEYDKTRNDIDNWKLEADRLEKKYGYLEYVGQEATDKDIIVDVGGQKYRVGLSRQFGENSEVTYYLDWADEFINGDEWGVDPEVFNQLANSEEVTKLIAEQDKIAAQINQANMLSSRLTDEQQAEINHLKELKLQIEDGETYLAENEDLYQKQQAAFDKAHAERDQAMHIMHMLGMDTSDFEKEDAAIGYLVDHCYDYEATAWSVYNPSDAYRIAIAEGQDINLVRQEAAKGNAETTKALEEAKAVRDYLDETQLDIPKNYRDNLDRLIAKLERDQKDYEYFSLSANDDFDELVKKGKQEEFDSRPLPWKIIQSDPEYGWDYDEYYQHLAEDDPNMTSIFAAHGLRGIAGPLAKQMTEDEKNIYYYLMGKGDEEAAKDYVRSLTDMSYGVLQSRYTEELKGQVENAIRPERTADFKSSEEVDKWIAENGDKDYNVTQDEDGYHIKWRDGGGAGNFIGTNILAILASPLAAMSSLGYGAYSFFSGKELNPDNVLLAFNNFRTSTREESAKAISEYYGEGTVAQKAVQMFYEIVTNRLDSLTNMAAFGGLIPDIGNEMLSEWINAYPMAFSAAMDTMMEVKRKGGSDAQAYGMGFVTFLAESGTEAISIDNIKGAFKAGEAVTADSLRSYLVNWLTQSGISEMVGETANDIIGNLADEAIMGELSDHKDRVWSYRMAGYGKEDAEAMARIDELKALAHTALVSYLSPGLDVVSYAAGRGSYYRQRTKQLQKAGNDVSIIDVLKAESKINKAEREANRAAEAAPGREPGAFDLDAASQMAEQRELRRHGIANGEGAFNLGETAQEQQTEQAPVQQEAAPEAQPEAQQGQSALSPEAKAKQQQKKQRRRFAKDYYNLESVKTNTDTSSKTAVIASVLDTVGNQDSKEECLAAATMLYSTLGEDSDPVNFVQGLLLGANEDGVDPVLVKQAVVNAALGRESIAAYQVIQSEEFQNADLGEQAAMLAATVELDQNNQALVYGKEQMVHEYRVVNEEKELIKNGFLDGFRKASEVAQQAKANLEQARTGLKARQDELQAKSQAVQEANERFNAEPTAENQHDVDRALNEYNKADAVEQEYQQHLDNMQQANKTAQVNLKNTKQTTMRQLHEQAEANVAQMLQQRAEERAQRAAQMQAEAEQMAAEQAAAQAAEDERTGKAQEDRNNAIIEGIADNEHLEGEERDNRINELKEQADKVKIRITDLKKPVSNTEGALAVHAFSRKIGIPIEFGDLGPVNGNAIVRGKYVYDKNTGTAKIVLNQNLIKEGKMSVGQALVEASLHEIVHSMRNTGSYDNFRKVVMQSVFKATNNADAMTMYNENADFRSKVDDLIKERKAAGDENFIGKSLEEQVNAAEDEIVADFARLNLAEKDVVQRFMDAGLGGRIRNALHNINQALKNYFGNLTGEERKTAEYLRRAERAFQKAMVEAAKSDIHPNSDSFSVSQIAESMKMGMVVNDDTLELYMPSEDGDIVGDGKNGMEKGRRYVLIDGVTEGKKITSDMIVNTPVGMLIDMGLSNKEFTDEQGNVRTQQGDARQMFADLMNLCARYKDNNLIWEIAGSEFSEAFSALKSNSDPQYKNTVDFGTICSKTQAVVDVLSQTMIDRVNAIRQWNEEHKAEIEAGTAEERVFTGLKREDIMEVYDITHNSGLSVPCPVCYVFSRWMGVPGMLGQMNRFQHQYVALSKDAKGNVLHDENGDAVVDWDKTFDNANNYLHNMVREYTKTKDNPNGIDITNPNMTPEERKAAIKTAKDKIADQKNSINGKIRSRQKSLPNLNDQLAVLQEKLDDTTLTPAKRKNLEERIAKKEAAIKKNIRETDQFMDDIKEFEAFNWVSQVICLQHTEGRSTVNDLDENGNFVMDKENFRYTPEEILFDLNRSGEFAGYAKNWRYRTTRGAGMGKAIMPYSGASIGDIIHGDALRWKQSENPLLQMDREAAETAWKSAKKRVKQQNLVGGQRFQSTSDFRPEWGLDYIMSFLEMQALGSKVQMYTKVAEAVDFLGSIGADVNLSIMAKNNGYHIATDAEIELAKQNTDKGREMKSRMGITTGEDGQTHLYTMEFSDVTGMDYDTAKGKTKKFNNVQMILVGMNDVHIRLALGNQDIDFIIPWHSSGNSKDVLQQLVSSVGEKLLESSDYTDTQTDQIKSHKEGKGKKEKTIDDRTDLEIARWNARMKILTGIANKDFDTANPEGSGFGKIVVNGKEVTLKVDGKEISDERQLVYNDEWLDQLYKRFYVEGTDNDCFGVALTKDQAGQIFPYEYWDKTSTRENADVNGERFAEYCDRLGLVPRFSQFKDVPGYWKLLIDRKMYDNNVMNEDGTVKEYGKYREQKVVDVTKARMDNDPDQALDPATERKQKVYQLPEETTARYGRKNYSEQTEAAIRASSKYLSEKYDVKEQRSELGDLTEADRDLMGGKERELNQTLVNSGVITPEELSAYQERFASRPLEGKNPTMSTAQGTNIRAFAAKDGMLQDADQVDRFAKAVVTAQNTYFPDTNEDQVIRAVKWIRSLKQTPNSDGFAEALQQITSDDFDYRSADGQARMVAAMGLANAKNDILAQTALADAFMRQGTDLGRALQARKLFKLMTPDGRISTLMKTLNEYNTDLKSKGMKGDLKFSEWILQAAAFADTQEDFRKVQAAAAAELAEKLPISWKERLNSFRMLSMLGNPRTHVRNLIGNALFVPAVGLKNKIGAVFELGVEKGKRTKTLAPVLNSEIREFARQDARAIKDMLTGEAKYDEHGLVEKAKNPLGPVLGKLSDLNTWALEGEDWLFLRGHYRRALGSWMQANGYTVEQMKSSKELLEKGREYAINEAKKATYRDFNGFAQRLNQITRNAETPGQKAFAFAINAALPFRRTPANILKRGIEYSPLGIARSVYNLGKMFRNGDVSATSVIDQFASGLAGTVVMTLGYLLAGTGAVSCGFDDDDWPEELKGKQKYSVNPGKAANAVANLFGVPKLFGEDVTYTLDWAAPMSMPLFVGASIRDQADTEGWDFNKVLDALGSISEPVFNLSMLDGVNSLIKVNSYSNENPFTQIGAKIASNYVTSYVPSVVGAITRTFFDDTQRKSFVTKGQNTGIEGTFRYAWETAENKLPGVSKTNIPVRDVWGREKTSEFAERLIENFISPGYIEHYEDDPVINELGRLFDSTGSPSLEPEHAATSIKIDKESYNFGPEEYDTFDRVHGETQYSLLKDLVNSKEYQDLKDDDAKVEIISKIYSYANDVAKSAVVSGYRYDKKSVDSFIHDGKVASYKTKMVKCLQDENYEGFFDYVEALREENVKDSDISSKIGDVYRDQWKDAYRMYLETDDSQYMDRMNQIESILDSTGFSYNIYTKNGWMAKVEEEYNR